METKKVVLPSQLITTITGASYKIEPFDFKNVGVRLHIVQGDETSTFYDRPKEGSLMLQEFWDEVKSKIYFEINERGELIAIFPEGFDGFIDENGDLILVEGSIEEI